MSRREPQPAGPAGRGAPAAGAAGLAYGAATAALTLAATLYARVPGPGAGQYFNLGEAVIYTAALVAGPWVAASGAVGAALADVLLGGTAWAPWTLAIKAVEAVLVGWTAARIGAHRGWGRRVIAILPGAAWMMAGYAVAAWVLLGPGAVPAELVIDSLQTSSSAAVALAVAPVLQGAMRRGTRDLSAPPG